MTTHEQITAAANIVRSLTPVDDRHAPHVYTVATQLDRWAASERAKTLTFDVALAIADTVDGNPDDYLNAAKAVQQMFDVAVDAEVKCGSQYFDSERWHDCTQTSGHEGLHRAVEDRVAASWPANFSSHEYSKGGRITGPDNRADHVNTPPTGIPADATGLKGRKARITGPHKNSWGVWTEESIDSWPIGTEVTIIKSPDSRGDVRIDVLGQTDLRIRASSLTLIPEPAAVPEPPVGTKLKDKDGDVWTYVNRSHAIRMAEQVNPIATLIDHEAPE